jgi:putative acetyltransferase
MQARLESPDQPEVIQLIAELDAYQDALYPPESRHALDLASLKQPNVLFAVARHPDGRAVGCGAIVLGEEYGEVKRMYVAAECRGQGVAHRLFTLLEASAKDRGCRLLMLETGPRQPEAIAFYERCGFSRTSPFGPYRDDPLSVFMRKAITTESAAA